MNSNNQQREEILGILAPFYEERHDPHSFIRCDMYTEGSDPEKIFQSVYVKEVYDKFINDVIAVPMAFMPDKSEISLLNPPLRVSKQISKDQALEDAEFIVKQVTVLLNDKK
ncbi:TPA: hypothetical protein ACWWCX_002749 [Enterococcus faecium]